jgi:GNAT superfamily N-acetyltransferase
MSSPTLVAFSPSDKKNHLRFVPRERKLGGHYPFDTAELAGDMEKRLTAKSAYFKDNMQYALYIATKDGKDVARCAALINPRYQAAKGAEGAGVGFIGYFAAAPDCGPEVAAMLAAAEAWLRARNITRIIAPYNGSALMGMGLLTASYDEEPMFPAVWTPPYYVGYITTAGFASRYPLWYYDVDFSSEGYKALKRKVAGNSAVTVRTVDKKKWKSEMETFRRLFNETFREEWEFAPMTSGEFNEFFDQLKPIVDVRNMLFAEVDGKVAGWCFGFPDWGKLFRAFKGTFGPLKLLNLLMNAGKYKRAGLVGIGVLDGFKGKGVAQALAATLYGYYEERGMKGSLYYPVNDHNTRSRKFAESIGGTGRLVMHCYDKQIG